ncbi:MAG: hypothetical protein CMM58_10000 [Rhodospirillaceae bacterium]|nr:hypothetical protein [Rhodospirillaceae bacterium]|tara:strand:- start:575 stop:925 length:351 start_codon:yes stop_codon:yes gene_type:complete
MINSRSIFLEKELNWAERVLNQALKAALDGKNTDLPSDLESRVIDFCSQIPTLSPQDAHRFATRMESVITILDKLSVGLTKLDSINKTGRNVSMKRASKIYQASKYQPEKSLKSDL